MNRLNNSLYNVLDAFTGETKTYNKITLLPNGLAPTDADCDGVIYRKFGTEYFVDNEFETTGVINARRFGAKGNAFYRKSGSPYSYYADSTTTTTLAQDDATAINAALTVAGKWKFKRATVVIPAGNYLIGSTLYVPLGVTLRGDSIPLERTDYGTTKLLQKPGFSGDVIRFIGVQATSGARYFWFGGVERLSILGEQTNTGGWGISFRQADDSTVACQDMTILRDIIILGMYGGGVEFPDAALPLLLQNFKLFFNNGPGISFNAPTTLSHQAICFTNISGDGNNGGLIYLNGLDATGNVTIINMKSEARINQRYGAVPRQQMPIVINNCDGTPVNIIGATHVSSDIKNGVYFTKPKSLVSITGTGVPNLTWDAIAIRLRGGGNDDPADPDPQIVDGQLIPYTVTSGKYGKWLRATVAPDRGFAEVLGQNAAWLGRSTILEGPVYQINGDIPTLSLYSSASPANNKHWFSCISNGTYTERKVNDAGTPITIRSVSFNATTGALSSETFSSPKMTFVGEMYAQTCVINKPTSSVSVITAANTAVYSPADTTKRFTVTGITIRITGSVTGLTAPPVIGFGTVAGTNNIAAAQTLTGFNSGLQTWVVPISGLTTQIPTSGSLFMNVSTPATATTFDVRVDVQGYYP